MSKQPAEAITIMFLAASSNCSPSVVKLKSSVDKCVIISGWRTLGGNVLSQASLGYYVSFVAHTYSDKDASLCIDFLNLVDFVLVFLAQLIQRKWMDITGFPCSVTVSWCFSMSPPPQ